MPLKNWCSIHARWSKSILTHSIRFCGIFPCLKQNFIIYRSSKVSSRPDFIFEIHRLWQSVFSRVYSNCHCSCSFEPEIMKIRQSSHKMYSNNIVNFQESTTILNASTKKSLETYWRHHEYIKYIWFSLVQIYGISTILGYLMPNPVHTYTRISNIYDFLWFRFMAYQQY